jgi:hypothetical protein
MEIVSKTLSIASRWRLRIKKETRVHVRGSFLAFAASAKGHGMHNHSNNGGFVESLVRR